jgi:hypothetical protein
MIPSQFLYQSGYARNAAESAHPELWKGLYAAWVPTLGLSGSMLRDLGGKAYHGTLTNMNPATDWALSNNSLVPGYDLTYNGSNQHINIPNFQPPLQGTLCQWAKRTSSSGRERPFGSSDNFEVKWEAAGTFTNDMFAAGGGTLTSTVNWTINVWMFTVFTYNRNNTTQEIYVDGKFDVISTVGANDTEAGPVTLGIAQRVTSTDYFTGQIGPTLFYDRVLRANEIRLLYENPLGMFEKISTLSNAPVAVPAVEGGAMFFAANF